MQNMRNLQKIKNTSSRNECDHLMCEGSSTEPNSYPLDDMLIDPQGEHSEYEVVHSEMHLLQDGAEDDMDHKESTGDINNINDTYYVENYEDNLE